MTALPSPNFYLSGSACLVGCVTWLVGVPSHFLDFQLTWFFNCYGFVKPYGGPGGYTQLSVALITGTWGAQRLLLAIHSLLPSTEPKKRQCKVLFEYNPVNEDELELKVGDIVDILEEVLQTCLLWVGCSVFQINTRSCRFHGDCVKLIRTADNFYDIATRFILHQWRVCIFHTRCAVVTSEFFSQVEEGWWSGSSNGKSGVFPSNFVKELDAAGDEQESNGTAADEAGKGVAEPCWRGPYCVFSQRKYKNKAHSTCQFLSDSTAATWSKIHLTCWNTVQVFFSMPRAAEMWSHPRWNKPEHATTCLSAFDFLLLQLQLLCFD